MANADELRARIATLTPERREQLAARVQREKEARRTRWLCDNDVCSGEPHPRAPYPHARRDQRLPFKASNKGTVIGALWMAGRGYGKTRTGAEGVRYRVAKGLASRVGLVGRTAADVRDVMVEGESGLLSVFPRWERPTYYPSKRLVTFHNGAEAHLYSSQEPDLLRGPQHDLLWGDEVSTWYHLLDVSLETGKPGPGSVLTNALLGLRLGDDPRAILTGTPRPTRDMKHLVNDPKIMVIKGTTYDNLKNLADVFKSTVLDAYEGTRLGRQELLGELLADVEGALLSYEVFDREGFRDDPPKDGVGSLASVVVGVDPAVTSTTSSDFTGISVCASTGDRRTGYVLHSQRFKGTPNEAMYEVAKIYDTHSANYVVVEVNQGGDYVKTVMKNIRPDIPIRTVHASKGKYARAEPVAALYEQGRINHIGSPHIHAALEDEWCTWVPDSKESPDVLDGTVWSLTYLMLGGSQARGPARTLRR